MNPIEDFLENSHEIEKKLGYTFKDKQLFTLAFMHRSFFNEHQEITKGHNERLEFLGDSILGLIVSGYLYNHFPSESEGHLSHLRAHFVGAEGCTRYIKELGLEESLLLGKGESENIGRGRDRILADLFEAIIGAIYLDGGFDAAEEFFLSHFSKHLDEAESRPMRNWKAELQDYSQKKFQKPPEYLVMEEEGPPHMKNFVIAAMFDGDEVGRGNGPSKKQAEQAAAEDALSHIEKGHMEKGEGSGKE